jgi:hypothetical protein
LIGAFGVIALATLGSVYVHPLAKLLQSEPFPASGWVVLFVVIIVTTIWSEPLKRRSPKGH